MLGDERLWDPIALMCPLSLFLVPWHHGVAQTGNTKTNTSAFPFTPQDSWLQTLSILPPGYSTWILTCAPSSITPSTLTHPSCLPTEISDCSPGCLINSPDP